MPIINRHANNKKRHLHSIQVNSKSLRNLSLSTDCDGVANNNSRAHSATSKQQGNA